MPLRFGVSRAHANTAAVLLEGSRRMAAALRKLLGSEVKAIVSDDYAGLLRATLDGNIDFAWMPPLILARAAAQGARLAAVNSRHGSVSYRSGLLVRSDSPLQSIADIRVLRVAWSDPTSASGYLLPRLYLRASGIDLQHAFASERFYGSAAGACAAVADGEADLCASFVTETAAQSPEQILTDVAKVYTAAPWRLRVIAVTSSIPSDGIVIGPHVGAEEQKRIEEVLLRLHTDSEGAAAMNALMNSERLVHADKNLLSGISLLQQQLDTTTRKR